MTSSTATSTPSRTTESELRMPTLAQAARGIGRALRLRCPHCGRGAVLASPRAAREWGAVRERCSTCSFRYERSDDRYFGGAMFINLMVAELLFAIAFVGAVCYTWPSVPWDAMTYGGAVAMLLTPVLMYPVSKVLWLAVDVLVRPVQESELR